MTDIKLKKAPDETETQFVYRLASARERGLLDKTWEELGEIFNQELGKNQCSSAYRKPYQNAQRYRDEVFNAEDQPERLKEIQEAEQRLYKERVKLRDERNDLNRKLREEARRESFIEKLTNAVVDTDPIVVTPCVTTQEDGVELVACLSDLHMGLTAANSVNTYNEDILHDRLSQYASKLSVIQKRHKAKRLVVAMLGDQISGSIHTALVGQNCGNTVEQLKKVCKEISGFIQALTPYFEKITVYNVSGNHSRINPKKDDAQPGDNLDSMIPFYLTAVFSNTDRVEIAQQDSYFGEYIQEFRCRGWQFVIVHGDLDTPDKVVSNIGKMMGWMPDVVLMGHRHNSGLITEGNTRVVQTGCICGTDAYAYNKRLFAPPEQSVVVVTDDTPIECLYNVTFL